MSQIESFKKINGLYTLLENYIKVGFGIEKLREGMKLKSTVPYKLSAKLVLPRWISGPTLD
jgi:hypothetical protein